MNTLTLLLATALLLFAVVVGWRLRSRRSLLPCPAEFRWLVECENPIARVTRSERVTAQLAPRPGERVLDAGCGPGRVTLPLARAVGPHGEVVALDVQPEMLARVAAKAQAAGLTHVRTLSADVRSAPLAPGSFDAAVLVMALGEVPEDVRILDVLYTALKPGGRLLIAESLFDPHYVRLARLRARAAQAGFREAALEDGLVAYSAVFLRPAG